METTLNIHASILERITAAACGMGVSRSELILLLVRKIMADIDNPGKIGATVRYQGRCDREEWRVVHIRLRPDEYEYFLDLRKILKMSVSLILAIGVKRYLEKTNTNLTDNYQLKNYTLAKQTYGTTIIWHLVWGYHPAMETLLL